MRTINNFQLAAISNHFASKVLGGGGEPSTLTTTGNDPKKFENLTLTVEVTGTANKLAVAATGGSTSTTISTNKCTTNGTTVTCPTTPQ